MALDEVTRLGLCGSVLLTLNEQASNRQDRDRLTDHERNTVQVVVDVLDGVLSRTDPGG